MTMTALTNRNETRMVMDLVREVGGREINRAVGWRMFKMSFKQKPYMPPTIWRNREEKLVHRDLKQGNIGFPEFSRIMMHRLSNSTSAKFDSKRCSLLQANTTGYWIIVYLELRCGWLSSTAYFWYVLGSSRFHFCSPVCFGGTGKAIRSGHSLYL